MYDYPLDPYWSTQEIIDVMALYNAVEKAYEEGISKEEFMNCYRQFTYIVDSKSEQKQIDAAFEKVSHYSIYKVFQKSKDNDWIDMR
ncbi:UPF0223 family protein [Candidatus Stoquefichus sp. SB1]|jgi:uncharacterized protein YktA (UPF0223 family)|uniref:UPF0223 family protein n=1 Tax=Candidatus Stoquefichus sp. SB1 TaxID=1658109 RepID=UPI00067F37E3|nr:UPF0223 family protein [Candidatus Stoquefichus sp. SB1]